jgi:hypothetical protein
MQLKKRRLSTFWALIILLLSCAIGWAVAESLSGQSNAQAANTGVAAAKMDMVSLETIKSPQTKPGKPAPNVDWAQEKSLRQKLRGLDRTYNQAAAAAQNEIRAKGEVSASAAGELLNAARRFQTVSNQYAAVWEKGNCRTRANLAREAGANRLAGAELIVAGADGDKVSALKRQQDRLNSARQAYVKEAAANGEISAADKASIKSELLPLVNTLISDSARLVSEVTGLLNNIRSQAQSLTSGSPDAVIGGMKGCASAGGGSSAGAASGPSRLLGPVTNLLSLAQSLASNSQTLLSDLNLLIK